MRSTSTLRSVLPSHAYIVDIDCTMSLAALPARAHMATLAVVIDVLGEDDPQVSPGGAPLRPEPPRCGHARSQSAAEVPVEIEHRSSICTQLVAVSEVA